LIERAIDMGHQALLAQIAHEPHADDPVQQAMQKYSVRMSGRMFSSLKPTRDGADVKWSVAGTGGPATSIAVIGILVSLLLPAVAAARQAAYRNQTQSKLKQIGLCLLNYESAYGHFPARAVFSKEGKPLLSWRVLMLPYMEEGELYKEFHLDEAWDSPHNKPLIARMPAALASPEDSDSSVGITHYVAPVGKGLMFDGDKGVKAADVTDGLSNTILAVEADKGVIWTKPDDLEVDLDKPFNGLGNLWPVGFMAVFGDCHITVISDTTDPATLKALFTRAGGEATDFTRVH
jgi:type II secretory pathway pseudopilin PulG